MNNKRLFPIVLILFTNILGAGAILPILPLFAEGAFQGTVFQITLLATAFFGAQFLASPWLGRLSDRYGRRPILLISQAGTVLSFVMFIFARQLGALVDGWGIALPVTGGILVLFVARTLDGITGGNISIAQAYVSDVTDPKHRTQGLGMLQAGFGAGFIFGPAFGGFLSGLGETAPFIGAAIITTVTFLLTFFILEESHPPEARSTEEERKTNTIPLRTVLSERAMLYIISITFLASLAFSALPATFALFADRVLFTTIENQERINLFIGLMLTYNGLVQVLTQMVSLRPLVKKFGERKLLILGEVALLVGFLGIFSNANPVVVTILFTPLAFGRGVSEPSLQALLTRFGTEKTRGRLFGIYQAARSLALIIGPIWAGYAFENIAPQAVFLVAGGLMLVALVFAFSLLRQQLPEVEDRPKSSPLQAA